jgi:hypothetical protein
MIWVGLFAALFIGSALALGLVLAWAFRAQDEDRAADLAHSKVLIGRIRAWLTLPTGRLTYQRDEKGRYRKVDRF